MNRTLVIYHGNCIDGFAAAWAARRHFGDTADYFPALYGQAGALDLPDVTGRPVFFVDFCPSRERLLQLISEAATVRVYDHHKTAHEACGDLDHCAFDMNRSGAGIAWDFFVGGPRPWFINYVEDRDLWTWKLARSQEVSAYISTLKHEFEAWDELLEISANQAADRGEAALSYIDRYVTEMSKQAMPRRFAGHDAVPTVNAPYINTSELVGHLATTAPFAVGWFQRDDGKFQYSLRSRGESGIDVSAIAKSLGGGGHRNAAGFVHEQGPWGLAEG
jgi:oligoribonuclease NrnB/cAMP/cGMP phosphodiesterase (DHH superfamily)